MTEIAVPLVMIVRDSVSFTDRLMRVARFSLRSLREVLADAIRDDDGVVHREADDREQAGHRREIELHVRERQRADGEQHVVDQGHRRAHAETQVESERDVERPS